MREGKNWILFHISSLKFWHVNREGSYDAFVTADDDIEDYYEDDYDYDYDQLSQGRYETQATG